MSELVVLEPESGAEIEIDIDDDKHILTIEKMQKFMPKGMSKAITQTVVDDINNVADDFSIGSDFFKEKVLAYAHLVTGRGMTIRSLMNAIKYVHFRGISAMTNEQAYALTFPEKYDQLDRDGKFIASYVYAYNGSDMVVAVQRLLIVEVGISCAPIHMAAIQKQVDLMNGIGANPTDRVSPTVQQMAAAKVADLTKMPEKTEHVVDVQINKGSIIDDYEKAIAMMAVAKLKKIEAGGDTFETINSPVRADAEIIDVDFVEFDRAIHDIDVYEKYKIIVERPEYNDGES